jgi:hypothetical protein
MVKQENNPNVGNSLLRTATTRRLGQSKLALTALRSGVKPPLRRVKVDKGKSSGESRVSDLTGSVAESYGGPAIIKEIPERDVDSVALGLTLNSSSTTTSSVSASHKPLGSAVKTNIQPKAFTLPAMQPKNVKKTNMQIHKGISLSAPSPMTMERVQVQMTQEHSVPESKEYKEHKEGMQQIQQQEKDKQELKEKKKQLKNILKEQVVKERGQGFEAQLGDFQLGNFSVGDLHARNDDEHPPSTRSASNPKEKKKSLVKKLLGKIKPKSPRKKAAGSVQDESKARAEKALSVVDARSMVRKALLASKNKKNGGVDAPPHFPVMEINANKDASTISDLDASGRRPFPVAEIQTADQARDDDGSVSTLGTPHVFESMRQEDRRPGIEVPGKTYDDLQGRTRLDPSAQDSRDGKAVDHMESKTFWTEAADNATRISSDGGAIEVVVDRGRTSGVQNGKIVTREGVPIDYALAAATRGAPQIVRNMATQGATSSSDKLAGTHEAGQFPETVAEEDRVVVYEPADPQTPVSPNSTFAFAIDAAIRKAEAQRNGDSAANDPGAAGQAGENSGKIDPSVDLPNSLSPIDEGDEMISPPLSPRSAASRRSGKKERQNSRYQTSQFSSHKDSALQKVEESVLSSSDDTDGLEGSDGKEKAQLLSTPKKSGGFMSSLGGMFWKKQEHPVDPEMCSSAEESVQSESQESRSMVTKEDGSSAKHTEYTDEPQQSGPAESQTQSNLIQLGNSKEKNSAGSKNAFRFDDFFDIAENKLSRSAHGRSDGLSPRPVVVGEKVDEGSVASGQIPVVQGVEIPAKSKTPSASAATPKARGAGQKKNFDFNDTTSTTLENLESTGIRSTSLMQSKSSDDEQDETKLPEREIIVISDSLEENIKGSKLMSKEINKIPYPQPRRSLVKDLPSDTSSFKVYEDPDGEEVICYEVNPFGLVEKSPTTSPRMAGIKSKPTPGDMKEGPRGSGPRRIIGGSVGSVQSSTASPTEQSKGSNGFAGYFTDGLFDLLSIDSQSVANKERKQKSSDPNDIPFSQSLSPPRKVDIDDNAFAALSVGGPESGQSSEEKKVLSRSVNEDRNPDVLDYVFGYSELVMCGHDPDIVGKHLSKQKQGGCADDASSTAPFPDAASVLGQRPDPSLGLFCGAAPACLLYKSGGDGGPETVEQQVKSSARRDTAAVVSSPQNNAIPVRKTLLQPHKTELENELEESVVEDGLGTVEQNGVESVNKSKTDAGASVASQSATRRAPPTPENVSKHDRSLLSKQDPYWDTLSTIASTKGRSIDDDKMKKTSAATPGPIPVEITTTNKSKEESISSASGKTSVDDAKGDSKQVVQSMDKLNTLIGDDPSDSSLSYSLTTSDVHPNKSRGSKEFPKDQKAEDASVSSKPPPSQDLQTRNQDSRRLSRFGSASRDEPIDGPPSHASSVHQPTDNTKSSESASKNSRVASLIARFEATRDEMDEQESDMSSARQRSLPNERKPSDDISNNESDFSEDNSALLLAVTRSEEGQTYSGNGKNGGVVGSAASQPNGVMSNRSVSWGFEEVYDPPQLRSSPAPPLRDRNGVPPIYENSRYHYERDAGPSESSNSPSPFRAAGHGDPRNNFPYVQSSRSPGASQRSVSWGFEETYDEPVHHRGAPSPERFEQAYDKQVPLRQSPGSQHKAPVAGNWTQRNNNSDSGTRGGANLPTTWARSPASQKSSTPSTGAPPLRTWNSRESQKSRSQQGCEHTYTQWTSHAQNSRDSASQSEGSTDSSSHLSSVEKRAVAATIAAAAAGAAVSSNWKTSENNDKSYFQSSAVSRKVGDEFSLRSGSTYSIGEPLEPHRHVQDIEPEEESQEDTHDDEEQALISRTLQLSKALLASMNVDDLDPEDDMVKSLLSLATDEETRLLFKQGANVPDSVTFDSSKKCSTDTDDTSLQLTSTSKSIEGFVASGASRDRGIASPHVQADQTGNISRQSSDLQAIEAVLGRTPDARTVPTSSPPQVPVSVAFQNSSQDNAAKKYPRQELAEVDRDSDSTVRDREGASTPSYSVSDMSHDSPMDVNAVLSKYDNFAHHLIAQNEQLKIVASSWESPEQVDEGGSNNTSEVLDKLSDLRIQRAQALARYQSTQVSRSSTSTPQNGGRQQHDASKAPDRQYGRRERDHVLHYSRDSTSLERTFGQRARSTGKAQLTSPVLTSEARGRSKSAEPVRPYAPSYQREEYDPRDIDAMSSSSDSTKTTPSTKARDLRKQLDEALQASREIRKSHENLGTELNTFKSRFHEKNNAIEFNAVQAMGQAQHK